MKLYAQDEQVAILIAQEQERQARTLSLIASENYVDQDILAAGGSILTNKYAEGYPGKRYYAGCRIGDQLELLAQERCKKLFNAEHVNVQPHAGSQANAAAYFALLQPGDTILGMSLAEGGHLTHGHKINFSGILYNAVQYTVDPHTHMLDYDAIEKIALECKPKMIIAGASAYCRTIDFERFGAIAKKVGAYLLADIAHIAGLVAVGLHPNPFPHADVVTSTTHKTLRGPRGGLIMCKKEFAQAIDRAVFPCLQGGPLMHVIAAKAVAFKQALQPEFFEYQQRVIVNAQALAQGLQKLGYTIITGGTDNHLFIVDLSNKGLTGKDAEVALEMAGIMVSRSCIPFDKQKPALTSGIRLGTPAITTRGMYPDQMPELASLIDRAIINYQDHKTLQAVAQEVAQMCCMYTHNITSLNEKQECHRF